MRWFTRDWQKGDLAEDEIAARESEYTAYVRSLSNRLQERVLVLALPRHRHLSVDDAKLDLLEIDVSRRRVLLRLLNGDLQAGYGKLDIECTGVDAVTPSADELRAIFADGRTEFLAQEIELVGDGPAFELRLLLWPRGELVIRCEDLRTTWRAILDETRADRRNEIVVVGDAPEGSTGHRIEVEGVGPCWLMGNGHTDRGRMLAVIIESGQGLSISKDAIIDPSPEVAAWVEGFLAGQEPDFAAWLGVDEPLDDALADEPALLARYEACLRTLHETGSMPYPLNRRPTEPPPAEWADRAWMVVAGEVLTWDGRSWSAAIHQPAFPFEVLVGSVCDGRGGHELVWVGPGQLICADCGLLVDGVVEVDTANGPGEVA